MIKVMDKITDHASTIGIDKFSNEIKNDFEQTRDSGIGVIYCALSDYPTKYSNFLLNEYIRGFNNSVEKENTEEILNCIEEIGYNDQIRKLVKNKLINFLEQELLSKNGTRRYYSIYCMRHWINFRNIDKYPSILNKLVNCIEDEDWRVRSVVKPLLLDIGKLPDKHREKIKKWMIERFKINIDEFK